MLSKLNVDFDFDTNTPIINIDLAEGSSILADRTLKQFLHRSSMHGLEIKWPKKDGDPYAQLRPCEDLDTMSLVDPVSYAIQLISDNINNGYLNADQQDKVKEFSDWVKAQQSF